MGSTVTSAWERAEEAVRRDLVLWERSVAVPAFPASYVSSGSC